MKKIITCLALMMCISPALSQDNYAVDTFERDKELSLKYNKFYFVHYIYFDVLLTFRLNNELDSNSKKKIIKDIYTGLNKGYQKQLTITSIKPDNLIVRFKPYQMKDDMSFIIYTNYDVELKKLVSIDSKPDNFYAKQYFIIGDVLIPGKVFYNKEDGKKTIDGFLKDKNYNGLADYILYDSDPKNDSEIPKYISMGLEQKITLKDALILKLTLLEYHLMKNDYAKADSVFNEIQKSTNDLETEKDKKYIHFALSIMSDIMDIMKYIK